MFKGDSPGSDWQIERSNNFHLCVHRWGQRFGWRREAEGRTAISKWSACSAACRRADNTSENLRVKSRSISNICQPCHVLISCVPFRRWKVAISKKQLATLESEVAELQCDLNTERKVDVDWVHHAKHGYDLLYFFLCSAPFRISPGLDSASLKKTWRRTGTSRAHSGRQSIPKLFLSCLTVVLEQYTEYRMPVLSFTMQNS